MIVSALRRISAAMWLTLAGMLLAASSPAAAQETADTLPDGAMSCDTELASATTAKREVAKPTDFSSQASVLVDAGRGLDELISATGEYWLVDLRPPAFAEQQAVPGALQVDWLGFRTLLRSSQHPILAMGMGDDDFSLARRLASAADVDRVRLLSGGVAAWVLAGHAPELQPHLQALLRLPSDRAHNAIAAGNLKLLATREPDRRLLTAETRVVPSVAASASDPLPPLLHWLDSEMVDQPGLVLAGDGDSSVAALAVSLSESLNRPVFYIEGGIAALEAQARRFADMNRQPRLAASPCR